MIGFVELRWYPGLMLNGRKVLPHETPSFIDSSREVFFITVCAASREGEPLMPVAEEILKSLRSYHEASRWELVIAVVMPDHVHFLVQPSDEEGFSRLVSHWKRWCARQLGIRWQRGFFEHRIRGGAALKEKANYVIKNPERGSLVANWREWPFTWVSDGILRLP